MKPGGFKLWVFTGFGLYGAPTSAVVHASLAALHSAARSPRPRATDKDPGSSPGGLRFWSSTESRNHPNRLRRAAARVGGDMV
jgi:hypothetical protein